MPDPSFGHLVNNADFCESEPMVLALFIMLPQNLEHLLDPGHALWKIMSKEPSTETLFKRSIGSLKVGEAGAVGAA